MPTSRGVPAFAEPRLSARCVAARREDMAILSLDREESGEEDAYQLFHIRICWRILGQIALFSQLDVKAMIALMIWRGRKSLKTLMDLDKWLKFLFTLRESANVARRGLRGPVAVGRPFATIFNAVKIRYREWARMRLLLSVIVLRPEHMTTSPRHFRAASAVRPGLPEMGPSPVLPWSVPPI